MPVQVLLNTTKLTEIFIECDDFNKGIKEFLDAQSLPPSLFIIIFQVLNALNGITIMSLKSFLNPIFQRLFLIVDSSY